MYASPYSDGTLVRIWIQPRASRPGIVGIHGDSVKVAVKAPPVEGRANEECVELLARVLGLLKRELEIKSGLQSRHKTVFVKGLTPDQVTTKLENAMKKA